MLDILSATSPRVRTMCTSKNRQSVYCNVNSEMRACRTIALAKIYQQVLCMQDLFYEDDSVLFIDMHQHEVWPGSGHVNESGRGAGDGFTINVPLPGVYFTSVHRTLDICPCMLLGQEFLRFDEVSHPADWMVLSLQTAQIGGVPVDEPS